jgi:MoaA/NifB/PqqE/SkfB family radical SAM enzyme
MPVNVIELEITSKCNAACPQCIRNFYGGPKWPTVPLVSLKLDFLKDRLSDLLSETNVLHLCGTYGDPCVHNQFIDIIRWAKTFKNLKLRINTNGGMKKSYWAELAHLLGPDDRVIFGIDGLEDTNHLYRRNVEWDVLMKNAKQFIDAGGKAIWQFIVFEHNQHQVDQASELSKSMGFIEFYIKKTIRFVDKRYIKIEQTPVVDKNKIYFIKPPTDERYLNPGYASVQDIDFLKEEITCMAKVYNNIYIGSDGYVFPCAWIHDRLYGYEPESAVDIQRIETLFELAGGREKANIYHTPIKDIIYGKWFEVMENSWVNEHRLERCARQCGKSNKLNTDVYERFFSPKSVDLGKKIT